MLTAWDDVSHESCIGKLAPRPDSNKECIVLVQQYLCVIFTRCVGAANCSPIKPRYLTSLAVFGCPFEMSRKAAMHLRKSLHQQLSYSTRCSSLLRCRVRLIQSIRIDVLQICLPLSQRSSKFATFGSCRSCSCCSCSSRTKDISARLDSAGACPGSRRYSSGQPSRDSTLGHAATVVSSRITGA